MTNLVDCEYMDDAPADTLHQSAGVHFDSAPLDQLQARRSASRATGHGRTVLSDFYT
ncbi:MAG TPA: hypothetical protein VFE79_04000 [Paraburkholderia sp.]|jgi:hypothetical protein|nr:hypothetical protein [Paraburkholderia sp.]